jgi:Tfp pilus assembly protein PilF/peroxiredoxin
VKKNIMLVLACTVYGVFFMTPAAATLQQLQAGMEAPDFSLRLLSGESRNFTALRGERLTIILFWSTWDNKSHKALARVQKLYQQYGSQGLSVIAVNADGQKISDAARAEIGATVARLGLTFPVLIDDGLTYFHDMGVIALPSTVIVNRDRTIMYELSGYPLLGAEEMVDFVAASIEGRKTVVVEKKGYQPNRNALRLFNMGRTTLKSGRMADSAEMWFKKAIEADPKFVLPHVSLGRMYLERGDRVQAEAQFKEALAKEPTHVIALCESAMLLFNDGKMAEGHKLLAIALKSDESYTPCYYYAGYAYGKEGDMEHSLKMFDEAAHLNPMDYSLYLYKARTFEEQNKLQEAAEAYKKALEVALKLH